METAKCSLKCFSAIQNIKIMHEQKSLLRPNKTLPAGKKTKPTLQDGVLQQLTEQISPWQPSHI
jgi:hypothetical protein